MALFGFALERDVGCTTPARALGRVLDAARDGTAYELPLASGPPIRRERR
jgi:hypothetical protein